MKLIRLVTATAMVGALANTPAAAQQAVPLVLNHLVVVLDSATWSDVRASPFLNGQFGASVPVFFRPDTSVGAVNLYGRYNYLVLAGPNSRHHRQTGDIAIVLASDAAGAITTLTARGPSRRTLVDSAAIPFDGLGFPFEQLRPSGADSMSAHAVLSMVQYTTQAAATVAAVDSLPLTNLATSRFLARYFDSRKLFSYLTGATLAMPVDDIAKIVRVLQRDGVTVLVEGEGAIIKLDGCTLHLIPSFVGAGVKQLQFALTHTAAGNPLYRFGPKSQLRFGPGPIAVWDFNLR